MKFKNKSDFIAIARGAAWKDRYKHDYIPTTDRSIMDWEPHAWVVEAMERAYTQGLADCKEIHDGE